MIALPGNAALWIGRTEVTWDQFDVFVFGLDQPEATPRAGVDLITRPSRPYLPPDRGFGHDGYPAMSMSHHSAAEFCRWLSGKTGRKFRLPTELEWERACRGGGEGTPLEDHAWMRSNSGDKPHPVGQRLSNALGLMDLQGNVAEWCTDAEGKPVARGGSYKDDASALRCGSRMLPSPAWNSSDPQIPKSRWWMADCSFVGFRVVCE
jgi:formylglycine-generating enzyme required for sulfatase activity